MMSLFEEMKQICPVANGPSAREGLATSCLPVQDNQPTIDITTDWGGAVPKGVSDWTVLENWQGPTLSAPPWGNF